MKTKKLEKYRDFKMTDLAELIETATRLSNRLSQAADDEKSFCVDLQLRFERLSWELFKVANEIQEIKYYL